MLYKKIFLILGLASNLIIAKKKLITLMLDPAGDAKNIGRIIDKYFERGITLQFAQAVKQELEVLDSSTRIVLTRFPGEMIEHLQNASFSNRLNSNLYVRFEFYPTDKDYSDIAVYYCSYNKQTDFWEKPKVNNLNFSNNNSSNTLEFITYNKAYKINFDKTLHFVSIIDSFFKDKSQSYSIFYQGAYGLPIRPLMGIVAPALLFEMGINKKTDTEKLVKPVVDSLLEIIKYLKKLDKEISKSE